MALLKSIAARVKRPGTRTIATPAKMPTLVGKIINKTPTPVPKVVPTVPAATKANVITLPKPVALAVMGKKVVPPGAAVSRAVKPTPEQPTTATPAALVHRAIERVAATVRMPDRGAAVVRQGQVIALPDGSAGGSPVTPKPLQQSLTSVFNQIVLGGGNSQVRQTQVEALTRSAYLDRTINRDVTASIGRVSRLGIVQRPGSAVVMKGRHSSLGALDKAMIHRVKPGTPTGVLGDRAAQYPTAHVGAVYARTVAPADTNVKYLEQKIGGSGAATAPTPVAVSTVPAPSLAVGESVGKAYAWAPADTTSTTPASAANAVQNNGERWGLLLAVGAIAALLILRR